MHRPAQSQDLDLAGQTFTPPPEYRRVGQNGGRFARQPGRLKALQAAGARDIRQRAAAFSKAGVLASGYFGIILGNIPLCGTAKDDRG